MPSIHPENQSAGLADAIKESIATGGESQRGTAPSDVYSQYAPMDKCPVDHKNMTEEELVGLMAKFKPRHDDSTHDPVDNASSRKESSDGCPVDHKNMSKEQIEAYMSKNRGLAGLGSKPVELKEPAGPVAKVYDVYGQEINPANMMPAIPNQLPSPEQKQPLSTDRVKSSIPKTGAPPGATWTYPSPQMFFNALKRKGKGDDVHEADMDSVVAIHNRMNERTWREVVEWERRFHCDECTDPKLRRFTGKPHDMSPAARFRSTFRGYPKPFDRHDWIVDRCGKADVRYIIDYYYRENQTRGEPIEVHVRPALDSPGAAYDRARYGLAMFRDAIMGSGSGSQIQTIGADSASPSEHAEPSGAQDGQLAKSLSPPRVLKPSPGEAPGEEEFEFLRKLTPAKIDEISDAVTRDCSKIGELLSQSNNDPTALEQINVALNYCMATTICEPQSKTFLNAMESEPGSEEAAYSEMTACLQRFHIMARRVMKQAAGIKQLGPER